MVRIAWNPGALVIQADMDDDEVTTRATADSQYLWEMGDVFEVFLEAEGAGYYTEMHVAPGNHRLHLRIRPLDFEAMRNKLLTPSDLMVRPPGFTSKSAITATGWTTQVTIPAAAVDPRAAISRESRWKASFCRYDAWSDGRPPTLSSTSFHQKPSFHERNDWRPLCF
jgi:hypothetical protein